MNHRINEHIKRKKSSQKLKEYLKSNFFQIVYYVIFAVIIVSLLAIKYSADTIYAYLGDFYYKHNNIDKAQLFYEKSFEHGNNEYKTREAYVNSIINSPLTTEAQEKLVKIAEDGIQDRASLKAKSFLYDLMREIHAKYSTNYITNASYNQKIVHWNKIPISYCYKNVSNESYPYIKEIDNAFNTWEKESKHRVLFIKEDGNEANIIIEFQQLPNAEYEYDKKYVVAYTTPIISGNNLVHMEIKFYVKGPDGTYFTPNQIYNTALHEIFHALGFMGHSSTSENIMYMSKNSELMRLDLRTELTEADLTTLELLYRTKPDITNDGNIKYDYIPYLILGDDENKNVAKKREAKNYIYNAPTLPNGYIDLAESLVAEGKYPEAIKKLEKALYLAESPDSKYVILYNLAVCYYYIANYSMAEEYINNAKIIKNSDELHFLLAEIYVKSNNYTKSESEYLYLINKNPENIDYTVNLVNIYIQQKQYIKARKILKAFIKNYPNQKNNKRISQYGILLL